ncbi:hypothetical protein G7B40_009200 [Aetokthonos hydrillicola Thurmond2011]|jgi:hypothetical protein|uniref:Uncharacterized protein n=1 Tax=Aetokthonos hydrillicola Thurmond2011 TaxID=2712845 RepID=A0AAP5I6N2_9CYAN|nr:hypothetical protein [Aetokthonos hydrillicola]MBO3457574.1 hypothetical protein [Aetokthonos hydrillicola CCALA 1050]MBW4590907.1 hypothetical protein [Aetokthonos hydrillicola CCALA 1050]MDR9894744.1 hypothetical protein [Aetokthonos hydrillicola Thurmond2011]
MNPIQYQTVALWQNLTNQETTWTYKEAIHKTWELLQQIVQLMLSLVLLFVAMIIWWWSVGFHSGRNFRDWFENDVKTPDEFLRRLGGFVVNFYNWLVDWSQSERKKLLTNQSQPALASRQEPKLLTAGGQKTIDANSEAISVPNSSSK